MRKYLIAAFLIVTGITHAQQSQAVTGFVHTDEVDLFYEMLNPTGKGIPLIVLHGGPGFPHDYLLQSDSWNHIASDRPVIFYDQRGVGKSKMTHGDATQSLDAHLSDLEALRVKLGIQQFDLAGHSWGGLLAMDYAAKYPAHIKNLILIDSAAPKLGDTQVLFHDVFPDVEAKDNQRVKAGAEEHGSMFSYFSMLFYSPEHRDAFIAAIKNPQFSGTANEGAINDAKKTDLSRDLAKFSFPTLVIEGRFDMNVSPLTGWKIYKAIPGATFFVFERSGHLPFYEEPENFSQVVGGFLNSRER